MSSCIYSGANLPVCLRVSTLVQTYQYVCPHTGVDLGRAAELQTLLHVLLDERLVGLGVVLGHVVQHRPQLLGLLYDVF